MNIQGLTNKNIVFYSCDYTVLKHNNRFSYYILWRNNIARLRESYTNDIRDKIRNHFIDNYDLFIINNLKIFDIQLSNNKMAVRLYNNNRRNNRAYKRQNISWQYCDNCGDLSDISDLKNHDDNYYCEKCFSDLFSYCENCDSIINNDDIHYTDDTVLCEKCYDEKYTTCYNCGDIIKKDDALIHNDNYYCENCFYDNFSTCENCGDTFSNDDLHYDENVGVNYCDNCHNENSIIHDYSYKPNPIFTYENYESKSNKLFLGIELEVEADDDINNFVENVTDYLQKNKIDKYFYFKHDMSLNNGVEVVSHPATLKSYTKKYKIRDILQFIKNDENKITSYKSGNCGLHIHMNKDFFSKDEINKLVLFFANNQNELKIFSKRKGEFSFCQFFDFNKKDYKIHHSQKISYNTVGRYAINTKPRKTIELRLFRGTINYNRFLACLQFADSIANFVKLFSIQAMNWKNYKMYLRLSNRYNHLLKYFDKIGL